MTRERKLAMDVITYMGDMGGARVKAHMMKHLNGTQGQFERDSLYFAFIHALVHV